MELTFPFQLGVIIPLRQNKLEMHCALMLFPERLARKTKEVRQALVGAEHVDAGFVSASDHLGS
jgi:hypothetical protein